MTKTENLFFCILLDIIEEYKAIDDLELDFKIEKSPYKGQNIKLFINLNDKRIKEYNIASFLQEDKTDIVYEINMCLLNIYDRLKHSIKQKNKNFLHICYFCGDIFTHVSKKFETVKCDNCLNKIIMDIDKASKEEKMDIYFIQSKLNGLIKIGVTGNFKKRLKQLEMAQGCDLVPLCIIKGSMKLEQEFHKLFNDYREKGEWFNPNKKLLLFIDKLNLIPQEKFKSAAQHELLQLCKEINIA